MGYDNSPEGKLKRAAYWKKYYERNQEALRKKAMERYNATKRKPPEFFEERKKTSAANARRRQAEYVARNREAVRARIKEWKKRNRDRINSRAQERYKSDIQHRIVVNLRNRIASVVRGSRKKSRDLVGCTPDELKSYLESLFKRGMTWENYGSKWHIDHILPCASFDLSKPSHQERCFHFTNLQPLFVLDNLRKNKNIPPNHQLKLLL